MTVLTLNQLSIKQSDKYITLNTLNRILRHEFNIYIMKKHGIIVIRELRTSGRSSWKVFSF